MNYGNAAGFETYHEARGREIPGTWDTDGINAALLAASEWIDGIYGAYFIGYKTDGFTQVQEWPRTNAIVCTSEPTYTFEDDAIPDRVVNATYEAAFRELTTPGSLQVDYTPGKYKKVSIEGALSVEYASFNNSYETQLQIGVVDTLLWPLLDSSAGGKSSGLSGASVRV